MRAAQSSDWRCEVCGETHGDSIAVLGADAPQYWYDLPLAERAKRAVLSSDQCVIDDKYFFVLGRLLLPVVGQEAPFVLLVWVSLSPERFRRMDELWTTPGREREPPYFGWLSTRMPNLPETMNLKCNVHMMPVGQRPTVELEPTSHPLSVAQRNGLTRSQLQSLIGQLMHPDVTSPHPSQTGFSRPWR
jgi:hypothetical protein